MFSKEEQALRAMMFEYINTFNDEERERIQFFPDDWREDYCAWSFLLGRYKMTWKYFFKTEQIQKESIDYVKFIVR